MVRIIAKETGIVILLLIVVALVMGILFYDYIPRNKTIPAQIEEFTLPQEVKDELQESMIEEQNIVKTYYVDSSDLSIYEASNDYDKGKANPFADYSTTITITSENTTNTNSSNTSSNISDSNVNNTQNTNQQETFFNTTGK